MTTLARQTSPTVTEDAYWLSLINKPAVPQRISFKGVKNGHVLLLTILTAVFIIVSFTLLSPNWPSTGYQASMIAHPQCGVLPWPPCDVLPAEEMVEVSGSAG